MSSLNVALKKFQSLKVSPLPIFLSFFLFYPFFYFIYLLINSLFLRGILFRCNLAVMLICDVIVAGIDVDCHSVDWSIHVPLMLHIITLGLDHSRPLVHQHCKCGISFFLCLPVFFLLCCHYFLSVACFLLL